MSMFLFILLLGVACFTAGVFLSEMAKGMVKKLWKRARPS